MEMIETRNIELLGRYFDEDGVSEKKQICVDDKTAIDFPLILNINSSTFNIKEVKMDFHVNILDVDLKTNLLRKDPTQATRMFFNNRLKRSKLEVSFDGKNDNSSMYVKIKFEVTSILESVFCIVDEYDKSISTLEPMSNYNTFN